MRTRFSCVGKPVLFLIEVCKPRLGARHKFLPNVVCVIRWWRVRAAEGARLESECCVIATGGSNPPATAIAKSQDIVPYGGCLGASFSLFLWGAQLSVGSVKGAQLSVGGSAKRGVRLSGGFNQAGAQLNPRPDGGGMPPPPVGIYLSRVSRGAVVQQKIWR